MKDGEKGSQEISRRIRKCLVSEVRKENSQEPLFVMGREGNLLKGRREMGERLGRYFRDLLNDIEVEVSKVNRGKMKS